MRVVFFVGSHFTGKTTVSKILKKEFKDLIHMIDGVPRNIPFCGSELLHQQAILSSYLYQLTSVCETLHNYNSSPSSSERKLLCATNSAIRFYGYASANKLPDWYLQLIRHISQFESEIAFRVFYFPVEIAMSKPDFRPGYREEVDRNIFDNLQKLSISYISVPGNIKQKVSIVKQELGLDSLY